MTSSPTNHRHYDKYDAFYDDDNEVIKQQLFEDCMRYQVDLMATSNETTNGITCSNILVQDKCESIILSVDKYLQKYDDNTAVKTNDQEQINTLEKIAKDRTMLGLLRSQVLLIKSVHRLYKRHYFIDIDKLWDAEPIPYDSKDSKVPVLPFLARTNPINIDYYKDTVQYANTTCSYGDVHGQDGNELNKQRCDVESDTEDEDESDTDDDEYIDRLVRNRLGLGLFGCTISISRLNLLPEKHRYATTWYRVIPWIIPGITISDWDSLICNNCTKTNNTTIDNSMYNAEAIIRKEWSVLQKCIHGIDWNHSKRRKRHSDRTPSLPPGSNSIQNNIEFDGLLGIRNFSTNHISLTSTASKFFDWNYKILIIPILTIEQVQQWNGMDGYNAIFVVGTYEGDRAGDSNRSYDTVDANMGGSDEDYYATVTDIQIATDLLRNILCHLAVSNATFQKHIALLESLSLLDHNDVKIFNSLANWNPNCPDGHVMVPTLNQGNKVGPINVRKVVFRGIQEPLSNDNPHHEAPDPMLLLLKAATVWSHRQQQPLLGGVIPKEDINDATSDEFSDTNDSDSTCGYESFDELELQKWNLHHLMDV